MLYRKLEEFETQNSGNKLTSGGNQEELKSVSCLVFPDDFVEVNLSEKIVSQTILRITVEQTKFMTNIDHNALKRRWEGSKG